MESESFLRFKKVCLKEGLFLDQLQQELLIDYVNQLLMWNSRVNLISRRGSEDVWMEHILHCLLPWVVVRFPPSWRVLDLGTGGGLPGVPLAIVRPDLHIVLVDSIRKKTAAVEEIISTLGLKNCAVVTGRIEQLGRTREYSRKFNTVVARAVGPLDSLIRWARPVLDLTCRATWDQKPTGTVYRLIKGPSLVAMKGGDLEDEVKRAALKTGERAIEVLPLPSGDSVLTGLEQKKLVIVSFGLPGSGRAIEK